MADSDNQGDSSTAYSKEKKRRGYASVPAIDPHDGGTWDVLISDSKQDWVASQGMGAAKELAFTVRWSLINIRAVFRGVRDLEREIAEDGWLCYVATPPHAYDFKTGEQVRAWQDEVFLVFVTEEREVYGWYWAKCDPEHKHLPYDFRTRFLEKVF